MNSLSKTCLVVIVFIIGALLAISSSKTRRGGVSSFGGGRPGEFHFLPDGTLVKNVDRWTKDELKGRYLYSGIGQWHKVLDGKPIAWVDDGRPHPKLLKDDIYEIKKICNADDECEEVVTKDNWSYPDAGSHLAYTITTEEYRKHSREEQKRREKNAEEGGWIPYPSKN